MNLTKNRKPHKTLEELTLLDRFLFAEVMDHPENMQILLEIIFSREMAIQNGLQTEKEVRRDPGKRAIRVDVWAVDEEENVYSTEVQKRGTKNLPKRSRLYQGLIDSKLLPPGVTDFNLLNDVFIIIISPFDLFGYGRYRYTFRNQCLEVPELYLEDGATRIFLNTRGQNDNDESTELVELLHYMEHTNVPGAAGTNKKLQQLRANVRRIQQDAEVGVRYMQAWEEIEYAKQEGRIEGRAQGLEQGMEQGRVESLTASIKALMNNLGKKPDEAMQILGIPEEERAMYLERLL